MQPKKLESRADERWRAVRSSAASAVQVGIAAGLSWWLATTLLPSDQPFYAPIGAVVAIGAGEDRMAGRSARLLGGMLTAVAVAGLAVRWIGTGPWQVVVLTIATTLIGRFLFDDALARSYASFYGALIGAMGASGLVPDRLLEAAIGAVSGLAVAHLIFPPKAERAVIDPLQRAGSATRRSLRAAADALRSGEERDVIRARRTATRAEAVLAPDDGRRAFARQLTRLAPARWRDRRKAKAAIDTDENLTPVMLDVVSLSRSAARVADRVGRPATTVARSLDALDHALAAALPAAENGSIGAADEIAGLLGRLPGLEESGDPHIQMLMEETREVADALVAASPSRAAD